MTDLEQTEWWREYGYLAGREIGGGLWVVLIRMIVTYRVAICTPESIHEFYCYPQEDLSRAIVAAATWDGEGDPVEGWVKHHPSGRRREPSTTKGE